MNFIKRKILKWVDENVALAIKTEVRAAVEINDIKHNRIQNKIRIDHYRSKMDFQTKIEKENRKIVIDKEEEYRKEIKNIVDRYETRIKSYKDRLKIMRGNVEFSQNICRSVYAEKIAIQNICSVLSARMALIIQTEKERLSFSVTRHATDFQEITACLEQADKINLRLDRQRGDIDKLIELKTEEIE
jgi:hypothetical protein